MDGARVIVNLDSLQQLAMKYPQAAANASRARITQAVMLLEAAIKRITPVGAGPVHMRDTIFSRVQMDGESVWGMIATPVKYGQPVEYGTRPHFPPVKTIQFWVEKKLGYTGKQAKSVAFLIARAISRRGTQAREPFGRGFEEQRSQVVWILSQIPADIVKAVHA